MSDLVSDILNDSDRMLIAAILFTLWKEKSEENLVLALLYILLA